MTLARTLLAAWTALGPAVAHAADSPTRLREDEYSIEQLLDVPHELDNGLYIVHCEVRILKSGKPHTVNCYTLGSAVPTKVAEAVREAARNAQFIPATRDNKPVEVFMEVTVRIFVGNGKPLVLAVPNNGSEQEKYGLLYTAPQRLGRIDWSRAFSPGDSLGEDWIWQELWIDAEGHITRQSLVNATGLSPVIMGELERYLKGVEFIPGVFEGTPVSMRLTKPVNVPFLKSVLQ